MKTCKTCSTDKSESEFYPRDNTCKECRKAKVRQNRLENLDKYREYDRQRANNPDRVIAREEYAKTDAGKAARARASRINRGKNPDQVYARTVLARAIVEWGMRKPSTCQKCGCECNTHGHHEDYSKPLDVIWVCAACHSAIHKAKRQQAAA